MCWRKTSHQAGPANHEFLQESPPLSSFSDQSSPLPFTVQQLQGDFISTFFLISLRWQVLHAIQRFASWKGQNNGAGCCFGQLVHSQDLIPTPGIPALISERHHWMKLPCLLLGPQGTAAPLPIWKWSVLTSHDQTGALFLWRGNVPCRVMKMVNPCNTDKRSYWLLVVFRFFKI